MLVNDERRLAFALDALVEQTKRGQESESMQLILAEDLEDMKRLQQPNDPPLFKWAPGLIGNDMSPEEFAETVADAMATGSAQ